MSRKKLAEAFLQQQSPSVGDRQRARAFQEEFSPSGDVQFDTTRQTLGGVFADSVRSGQAGLDSDIRKFRQLINIASGDEKQAEKNAAIAKSFDSYSSELMSNIQDFEGFLTEPTVGGFLTQVVKSVGQFTPLATSSLASGFTGAAAGLLTKATLSAGSKVALNTVTKEALKKSVKNPAALSKQEKVLLNEGYSYMQYAKTGGITGAFGQEYVIGSSQAASEFEEAGRELTPLEAYQSFLLGGPQAILGTASEVIFAGAVLKTALAGTPLAKLAKRAEAKGVASLSANEQKAYRIVQKIENRKPITASENAAIAKYINAEKNPMAYLIRDIGRGFAGSAVAEGLTETAQEGLGIAQRFTIDDDYTAKEAKLRLAEAAFAGFFAGGARGGIGGAATGIINSARAATEQAEVDAAIIENERTRFGEGESVKRKSTTEINAELEELTDNDSGLGKKAVYLPGVRNATEIPQGVDLSKISNLDAVPFRGGLIIGSAENLKGIRNVFNKRAANDTKFDKEDFTSLDEQASILLDREDFTQEAGVDTKVIVRNAAGTIIATRDTTEPQAAVVRNELQQKYPNGTIETRPLEEVIEERNMEGMFDDDPDLDDLEVQQDLATDTETETTETDIETGASPEDALTLPPGVVRGTITDSNTGAVRELSETERSYKKSRFVPDENDTSADAVELRDLRNRYIEQLATPEERSYWNPEVGPKPIDTLSASALRKFFELKTANPDLVIGESLEDANRFAFYTYGDQNAQFQARKAVSDAVLETIRSPNQASPGWTVEITDPEAPSSLGFGERKVTFKDGEPKINMQTLLQQAVQNFEREGYQQNLDAGQNRRQALMNSLLPTLEALKNNGYAIKVRDVDGNVVDAVERPDIATRMPIVRGERGAFVSAEQVLGNVRVTPRKRGTLKKVISGGQTGADIAFSNAAKAGGIATGGLMPRGFKTEQGSRPEYQTEFNMEEDTSADYRSRTKKNVENSDGTLILVPKNGNITRGSQLTINFAKAANKPYLVITENTPANVIQKFITDNNIETLNGAGSRGSTLGDTTNIETALTAVFREAAGRARLTETESQERATLGDESPEVADQTELERMMEQTDEVEGPTAKGESRKLPSTRINIEEARTGFTETLERRGAPVTFTRDRARQVQIEQAERNQAARAAEPTTTTPRPTQIEEGIEASDSAANLFDLQQAAGNTISGRAFINNLSRKFTNVFKSRQKVFVITSTDNVTFGFDNKTYRDAGGNEISPNDLIKQKQAEMEANPSNFGKVITFGNASIVILNEQAFDVTTNQGLSRQINLTYTLGHELGHVLYKQEINRLKQNKPLFDSMYKEFLNDAKKNVKQYDSEFGFEEWYSDQMAMYLLDQKDPVGQKRTGKAKVAAYFNRLAKAIKRFFNSLHQEIQTRFGAGINPKFNEYVNGITRQYREGLTPEEMPITVKQSVQIDDMVAGAEKFIGSFVGKKNATRFGAQMKKILRGVAESEMAKDITDFTYRILAPADNYLRRISPELGRALYSRSQTQEALGFFQKHPLLQNGHMNKFYDIFNLTGEPTDADLTRIDEVTRDAERLAAGTALQNPENRAQAQAVLDFFDDFWSYVTNKDPELGRFKRLNFFTRQFDMALLENDPAARSRLVDVLEKNNPTTDRNILEDAVEKMIRYNENTDGVSEVDSDNLQDISIGMQKERAKFFENITDNSELRDDPNGEPDLLIPPHHAIRKYVSEVVKKTEYRDSVQVTVTEKDAAKDPKKFKVGQQLKGAEATEVLLNRIEDPKKRSHARKAVQAMLGRAGMDMPGWLRTTQSYLLMLNAVTYLSFAAVASLPDLAGPTLRSKEMFLFSKTFNSEMRNYFNNRKEMEAFARDVGVVTFDSVAHMYINAAEMGYMTENTKFYTQKFFKYTGLEFYTRFTRVFAAGMGKQFLIKHANDNSAKSQEYLSELGVTAADVKAVQAADFNFETEAGQRVKQAIGRFVEESIVRPNAAERPVWASNPYFGLVFQLKSFFYAYGKNIVGGVIRNTESTFRRDGKISTAAMPAVYAATALLPLAVAGMELRELMKFLFSPITGAVDFNDKTDAFAFDSRKFRNNNMSNSEYLIEAVDRSGALGAFTMLFPMMEAGRFGDEFYTPLLGPTVQRFEDIIKNDAQFKDFLPFFGSY